MKLIIKNFTDTDSIGITCSKPHDEIPQALVQLQANSGSMWFHHAMRIEQARFLAAAITMAADEAEAAQAAFDAARTA